MQQLVFQIFLNEVSYWPFKRGDSSTSPVEKLFFICFFLYRHIINGQDLIHPLLICRISSTCQLADFLASYLNSKLLTNLLKRTAKNDKHLLQMSFLSVVWKEVHFKYSVLLITACQVRAGNSLLPDLPWFEEKKWGQSRASFTTKKWNKQNLFQNKTTLYLSFTSSLPTENL